MLNASKMREILKEYDDRRILAQEKHKQNLEKLYNEYPLLYSIEKELESIVPQLLRVQFSNLTAEEKGVKLQELESSLAYYKEQRRSILRHNGLPEDALEVPYTCKTCKDTGYIMNHNIKERCICLERRIQQQAFSQSNLFRLDSENLSTFNLKQFRDYPKEGEDISPRENMSNILEIVESYIERFNQTNLNLIFIGEPGRGKTFLCNCIANELLQQHQSVLYFTSNELLEVFNRYRFAKTEDEKRTGHHFIEQIENIELLIIDDLGTEMTTAFSGADLFTVINTRILKRKKMIISTNLSLQRLETLYSQRITSRLTGKDFTILHFFGDDLRQY